MAERGNEEEKVDGSYLRGEVWDDCRSEKERNCKVGKGTN